LPGISNEKKLLFERVKLLVIETEKLTKIYGNKTGCSEVTLSVNRGEIFGFLGPNGAGKSTFTKLLVGLLFKTSGKAQILGKPLGDIGIRSKIGYLPENFRYQDWMTGADLLSFHASLYKMSGRQKNQRVDAVLELVRLKGQENYKIGTYSKGMQQRLGIASALLPDPELLFLDEPTSALDPIGRKEVRDIMLDLRDSGKTVFLNSHLLNEVEMICDSLAFINKGVILNQGRLESILGCKVSLTICVENLNEFIRARITEFDKGAVIKGNRIRMNARSNEDIAAIAGLLLLTAVSFLSLLRRRKHWKIYYKLD
jgi:ABC-2 type transport system ATP-binding protein